MTMNSTTHKHNLEVVAEMARRLILAKNDRNLLMDSHVHDIYQITEKLVAVKDATKDLEDALEILDLGQ